MDPRVTMNNKAFSDIAMARLPELLPPRRLTKSAWKEHIPFGMLLVSLLRPRLLVELGTECGDSYCGFCQVIDRLDIGTKAFAIDTWQGDPQAGFYDSRVLEELRAYHDPLYGRFSTLLQSTFDEALPQFAGASIDLLHIDGLHTYEAVKHDFETWLPKMSSRGIVLFHDTNVPKSDFGVGQLWREISVGRSSFEFFHGHGLGVLAVGADLPIEMEAFFHWASENPETARGFFEALGHPLSDLGRVEWENRKLHEELRGIYDSRAWKVACALRKVFGRRSGRPQGE